MADPRLLPMGSGRFRMPVIDKKKLLDEVDHFCKKQDAGKYCVAVVDKRALQLLNAFGDGVGALLSGVKVIRVYRAEGTDKCPARECSALYVMWPNIDNLKSLQADMEQGLFRQYHLLFTHVPDRETSQFFLSAEFAKVASCRLLNHHEAPPDATM